MRRLGAQGEQDFTAYVGQTFAINEHCVGPWGRRESPYQLAMAKSQRVLAHPAGPKIARSICMCHVSPHMQCVLRFYYQALSPASSSFDPNCGA